MMQQSDILTYTCSTHLLYIGRTIITCFKNKLLMF